MPRVRLSDPKVKALEEPGDYWDAQEPGLILKVNQGGAKAWSVRYRAKGRYRRFKIGSYPIKGLSEARRDAKRILSAIQSGADPQADRLKERMEGKALKPLCIHVYPLFQRGLMCDRTSFRARACECARTSPTIK